MLCIVLAVLLLTSCVTGRGASKQQLLGIEEAPYDEKDYIDLLFGKTDMVVSSVRIRGEGPDGAYFDWIPVNSDKIVLTSGIKRGEWTIYVQGLSSTGAVVATGTMKTFLSENTPVANIILDQAEGYGDVSAKISWNIAQIRDPEIEVYIKDARGGSFSPIKKDDITIYDGFAIWDSKNIKAGSYIVRVVLKDGDYKTGAAASIRVYDGLKSSGTIPVSVGDIWTAYGITTTVDDIDAHLDYEDDIVTVNGSGFTLATWYLNGVEIGQGRSVHLRLLPLMENANRIDVIVSDESGRASYRGLVVYKNADNLTFMSQQEFMENLNAQNLSVEK